VSERPSYRGSVLLIHSPGVLNEPRSVLVALSGLAQAGSKHPWLLCDHGSNVSGGREKLSTATDGSQSLRTV
jgi:hypothetical protein